LADGRTRMIIWVMFVFVIAAGASAYGVIRAMNAGVERAAAPAQNEELGPVFDAGVFTVDLTPDQRTRILRISVKLQTNTQKAATQLGKRVHEVKDAIVGVLRNRTAASLTGLEGMESLRRELLETLNRRLALDDGITDVYFPDMVMQ
jgi:flagellar FliL protein